MKIEEFINFLNSFDKLFLDLPESVIATGELPCFERTSPFVKYSKSEFSNDSIDVYVGYIEMGIVYLKYDNGEKERFDFGDDYQCTQYMNKKIFIEGKPIMEHLGMACNSDELQKAMDSGLFISNELIGDTFPDMHYVTIDLTKVTFNHYKTGEPDYDGIAKYSLEISKLKANLKVVKWYINAFKFGQEDDKYKRFVMEYTPEQIDFLKKNRLNDFGFSGIPMHYKKLTPIDIKISGLSNLPKVDDIVKRIDENKQQTTAGNLMLPMVQSIRSLDDSKKADILITYSELTEEIAKKQTELRKLIYNVIINKKLRSRGDITEEKVVLVDDFEIKILMTQYGE